MIADLAYPSSQNLMKDVIRVIMALDRSKKPFKYSDIVSYMNPRPTKKEWTKMFTEAKNFLNEMGLDLHELNQNTSTQQYFVTSQSQPLEMIHKYADEEEISFRILLTFVLAFIFMKNGVVHSERLLVHLQELGIYNDEKPFHPYFGNVRKRIFTDSSNQMYLALTKLAIEPELYEIRWGERAEIEMRKKSILDFICNYGFLGKTKPEDYNTHYEIVVAQEEGEEAVLQLRRERRELMKQLLPDASSSDSSDSDSDSDSDSSIKIVNEKKRKEKENENGNGNVNANAND